jgi:hypothetical protein
MFIFQIHTGMGKDVSLLPFPFLFVSLLPFPFLCEIRYPQEKAKITARVSKCTEWL